MHLERFVATVRRFRWAMGLIGMVTSIPMMGSAQAPSSNLGLQAVGGIGIHGGYARLERDSRGREAGLLLDVGWWRGQRLRLQAELSLLRGTLTEYVELEDSTFHGDYYDLTGGVTTVWLASHTGKVSPYALAGLAVHTLSSAFQNAVLDQRYNANRFGSHIGGGIRIRFGHSRQVLYLEARRVIADQVDRSGVRVGGLVLLGDLYR